MWFNGSEIFKQQIIKSASLYAMHQHYKSPHLMCHISRVTNYEVHLMSYMAGFSKSQFLSSGKTNKVNSYSNQLKLSWVCKLEWSLTKFEILENARSAISLFIA